MRLLLAFLFLASLGVVQGSVPGSITPDTDEACLAADIAWDLATWRDRLRGSSVTTCDTTLVGDGRCDLTNNMNFNGCAFDGGDCCMSSCLQNCMAKQQKNDILVQDFPYYNPRSIAGECLYKCGTPLSSIVNCPFLCLDDGYVDKGITYTSWCQHDRGVKMPMSECFNTKPDVAVALRQCIMDDRSNGNSITASFRCANQSEQCSMQDVYNKNGCELHPTQCTKQACCSKAIAAGWIDPTVKVLPSLCEVIRKCEAAPDCFPSMAACIRENKACQGGCCKCNALEWYGPNCDQPLCWSKCRHGTCVAPNMCHCDQGWTGPSCETAVCSKPCVAGQGVCVGPERCECLYGWTDDQCQTPVSYPACVNGVAIAPDVCKCEPGWGGRICDYPLCQAYPFPSSDCGHGVCESPFKCKCEPGWDLLVTVDADGKDKLPFWWKGRNAVPEIAPTDFVFGDSRFDQLSETSYVAAEYNAFQCLRPDCRLITDANCLECQPITAECTKCDPGFFLAETGRCTRCNPFWPHCRLCNEQRCLDCDPLFVMKNGTCISDGIIEFSSAVYHADVDAGFVDVKVVRSQTSVLGRDQRIAIRLQTIDDSAISSRSKGAFADFKSTGLELFFEGRDDLEKSMRIPIFDNVKFDAMVKSFRVRLIVEPEVVQGSDDAIIPLYQPPTPSEEEIVANVHSECRVYIWDQDFFSMTFNRADSPQSVRVGIPHSVTAVGLKCIKSGAAGCDTTAPMTPADKFRLIVTTQPILDTGVNIMLGDAVISDVPNEAGEFESFSVPFVPGQFWINVMTSFSGAVGEYYDFNPRPSAGQLPNFRRVDTVLGYAFDKAQFAPAFVRWESFLQFSHLTTLPTQLAFAISPDTQLSVFFKSAGRVQHIQRPFGSFAPVDFVALNKLDWVAVCTDPNSGVYCLDVRPAGTESQMAVTNTVKKNRVLPNGVSVPYVHPIRIELGRTSTYLDQPSYFEFLMYVPGTGWAPVPPSCFLAGVHVDGSPRIGYSAVAGDPVASMSLVEGISGERLIPVSAGNSFQVRVTLMDVQGNIILDGSYSNRIIVELSLLESTLVAQGIVWNGRYFVATLTVPAGSPQYETSLTATFDGVTVSGSPLAILIKAATSDPARSILTGNYSSIDVDVKRCLDIISFDAAGNRRLDGGDQYDISLSGPLQAPKPTVPLTATDNGDGSYTLCLQLLTGGEYQISISLKGVSISGSPFQVHVVGVVAAGASVVRGVSAFGVSPVVAGQSTSFWILTKDKYGQTYYDAPQLDVSVEFSPPQQATDALSTEPFTNGTIRVDFANCIAGSSTVAVIVSNAPVKNSPFLIEIVPDKSDASKSVLKFPEISPKVGVATSARLELFDQCGNSARDGLTAHVDIDVSFIGGGGALDITAIDAAPVLVRSAAVIIIKFIPQRKGLHSLSCRVDGVACQGTPYLFNATQLVPSASDGLILNTNEFSLDLVGLSNLTNTNSGDFQVYFADEEFEIDLVPRDSRYDAITSFTDTTLVTLGLWRSDQCPSAVFCEALGTFAACSQFQGCVFDTSISLCAQSISGCLAGPPPLFVDQLSYFFSIVRAGTYVGRFVVDRPGAFRALVFRGSSFAETDQLCEERVRLPLNLQVDQADSSCLSNAFKTRNFSIRLLGKVRGESDGVQHFSLQSPCENVALFVDGVKLVAEASKTDSFFSFDAELSTLRNVVIRVDLICASRKMKTDFYARLLWVKSADRVYSPVPATAAFYAEPSLPEFQFVRVIRPLVQAEGVSWLEEDLIEVAAGSTFSVAYVGLDTFDNVMQVRDPGATFSVFFDPAVPSHQYSVTGNLDGTFNLTVSPTNVAKYTMDVVLNTNGKRISREFSVIPAQPDSGESEIVCDPQNANAGTLMSCVLQVSDASGNIIGSFWTGDFSLEVIQPDSAVLQLSVSNEFLLTQAGSYNVLAKKTSDNSVFASKQFSVAAGDTHPCCVEVTDIIFDKVNQLATFDILARDTYSNVRTSGGNLWRVLFAGPEKYGKILAKVEDLETGVFNVTAKLPDTGAVWSVSVELADEKSSDSPTFCREIALSNTYVANLTNKRYAGSVATLSCNPGYQYSSGVSQLTCGSSGGWDGGRPLACRVKYGFCPNLPFLDGVELLSTSLTRRVLEVLDFRCAPGYKKLMGDENIFCGYDGKYRRVQDSVTSQFLQCMRVANFCPDVTPELTGSFITTMTSGRNVIGTRIDFSCEEGFVRESGDPTLLCISGSTWASTRFTSDGTRLPGTPLKCAKRAAFCPAPSVSELVIVDGYTETRGFINDGIQLRCGVGAQPLRGMTQSLCGASGLWMDNQMIFRANLLECDYVSGVCANFVDSATNRWVTSLSRGTTRDSVVTFECAPGFSVVSGTSSAKCELADSPYGSWTSQGESQLLTCSNTAQFCPFLAVEHGVVTFSNIDIVLGTVASVTCHPGFTFGTAESQMRFSEVVCGRNGTWMELDFTTSVQTTSKVICRPTHGYCGEVPVGEFRKVARLSNDLFTGSIATLECLPGYFKASGSDELVCDHLSASWISVSEQSALACIATSAYCPEIGVFTDVNGTLTRAPAAAYSISSTSRAIKTQVAISCRMESDSFYSMGDVDVTCGSDGKWKSTSSGLDAKDLVCLNTFPPMKPVNFAAFSHGCAYDSVGLPVLAANPFDYYAGVSGTVSVWVNSGCAVPASSSDAFYLARLRLVENGVVRWGFGSDETLALKITADNRLQAKIALNCGDIRGGIGYDADIPLSSVCRNWMHVAFSWDANAPDSNAEVYVNGVRTGVSLSRRVTTTCASAARAASTQQGAAFVVGDESLSSRPHPVPAAKIAAISTYVRRLSQEEILSLYFSQKPSCDDKIDACSGPELHNADVFAVGNADQRFRAHARMQGGWISSACRPGFVALSGDAKMECRAAGWRVYGFPDFPALPLVCCRQSQAFCPALVTGSDSWSLITAIDDPKCSQVMKHARHFGAQSTRTCSAGYRPQVQDTAAHTSVCSYDGVSGVWKTSANQDLVCIKMENFCPVASGAIQGAVTVSSTEGRRVASNAILACLEGYDYVSGDLQLTCGSQGSWLKAGTTQAAQPISCSLLETYCPPVTGGNLVVTYSLNRRLSSVATLTCATGTEAVAGDTQWQCALGNGVSGRWTRLSEDRVDAQLLKCEQTIDWCSEPTLSTWTFVQSTTLGRRLGSVARIACREGHFDASTSFVSQDVVCDVDRNWVDSKSGLAVSFLDCAPIADYCVPISSAYGVQTTQSSVSLGSVAELSCSLGYGKSFGRESFRCGIGRTYRNTHDNAPVLQSQMLKCAILLDFCPPVYPVNARVEEYSAWTTLNSKITMKCLPGYNKVTGDEQMTCLSTGSWSGVPLECSRVTSLCPPSVPAAYTNAEALIGGLDLGDRAQYACNELEGEYVMGMTELVCSQDADEFGSWREASTGAPWSLPFECAMFSRQGVSLHVFGNLAFQGTPIDSRVVRLFEYRDFESAIFHSFIKPDRELENCVFSVEGTEGMIGTVNIGDSQVISPVDFPAVGFTEVTAMISYRAERPSDASFANVLWKCNGDSDFKPINSAYLIHTLLKIDRLTRIVTL